MNEAPVVAILGSGFGMYGYLPALLELGCKVLLPMRYQSTVRSRPELSAYLSMVTWCTDTEEALRTSNAAVIALRPSDQADWIPRLAQMPNIRQLILEKPVAPTPQLAEQLSSRLENAGKQFRVAYTFRFLPWAERLWALKLERIDGISLDWQFMAHHYRANLTNWKRFDASGGGALRFYGIHVIALAAELGYDDVQRSTIFAASEAEAERWEAVLVGRGLCPFTLKIDSCANASFFRIVARDDGSETTIVDQPAPFSLARPDNVHVRDPRVDVLKRFCLPIVEGSDEAAAAAQHAVAALWARIESKSEHAKP